MVYDMYHYLARDETHVYHIVANQSNMEMDQIKVNCKYRGAGRINGITPGYGAFISEPAIVRAAFIEYSLQRQKSINVLPACR